MEQRTITVIDSRSQRKYVISSLAETLGDLKADLIEAGVSGLNGMVFKEGTTRAEYTDDTAVLPREVMYRGRTTNDLAFMIVEPRKKIMSGDADLDSLTRSELYQLIKANDLQDYILEITGDSFTKVANSRLRNILSGILNFNRNRERLYYQSIYGNEDTCGDTSANVQPDSRVEAALQALIDCLEVEGHLEPYAVELLNGLLNSKYTASVVKNQPFEEHIEEGEASIYVDDDLLDMFD